MIDVIRLTLPAVLWVGIVLGLSLPMGCEAPPRPGVHAGVPSTDIVGDIPADDTDALQNALNTQKRLVLAPRTYRITRSLKLSSGCAMIGPATLLVDFDTGTMDAANAALHASGKDIRVEGVTIVKPFRDGSYAVGILAASGSSNVVVRNVEISGYSARYGIHLIETENFEISGCYIHDFLVDSAADMILDSPAGIRVTRSRHGVVSHNRVLRIEVGPKGYASVSPLRPGYGRQGYQSDCLTIMQSRDVAIVGNVLDTSGEAIDLLLSEDCSVSGNVIGNVWFQGIKMLGVRHCSVSGNVLRDCLQGIGLAEHVGMKTDCVGNTVTGNTIVNAGAPGAFRVPIGERAGLAGAFGIDLSGRCVDNVIAHNTIRDTQAQATMKVGVRQELKLPNLIEGNHVSGIATLEPPAGSR